MADLLIVDDDPVAANALAKMLRNCGHHANCVSTAGEALHQLRLARPDLVVLDLSMPQVDGLDFLEALTSEMQFADIPVAFYTGHDYPAARDAARQLGARDYILKGQESSAICHQIEQCVAGQTPS